MKKLFDMTFFINIMETMVWQRLRFIVLTIVCVLSVATCPVSAQQDPLSPEQPVSEKETLDEIPEWLKRTNYGLDVGTGQKPRGYFETIQPLYQDSDKQNTVFIQPRFSYMEEDFAANLGVGYRRLFKDNSVLLGTNLFFDYENRREHYRAGLGFEAFINRVESRFNTYFGLSPTRVIKTSGSHV